MRLHRKPTRTRRRHDRVDGLTARQSSPFTTKVWISIERGLQDSSPLHAPYSPLLCVRGIHHHACTRFFSLPMSFVGIRIESGNLLAISSMHGLVSTHFIMPTDTEEVCSADNTLAEVFTELRLPSLFKDFVNTLFACICTDCPFPCHLRTAPPPSSLILFVSARLPANAELFFRKVFRIIGEENEDFVYSDQMHFCLPLSECGKRQRDGWGASESMWNRTTRASSVLLEFDLRGR